MNASREIIMDIICLLLLGLLVFTAGELTNTQEQSDKAAGEEFKAVNDDDAEKFDSTSPKQDGITETPSGQGSAKPRPLLVLRPVPPTPDADDKAVEQGTEFNTNTREGIEENVVFARPGPIPRPNLPTVNTDDDPTGEDTEDNTNPKTSTEGNTDPGRPITRPGSMPPAVRPMPKPWIPPTKNTSDESTGQGAGDDTDAQTDKEGNIDTQRPISRPYLRSQPPDADGDSTGQGIDSNTNSETNTDEDAVFDKSMLRQMLQPDKNNSDDKSTGQRTGSTASDENSIRSTVDESNERETGSDSSTVGREFQNKNRELARNDLSSSSRTNSTNETGRQMPVVTKRSDIINENTDSEVGSGSLFERYAPGLLYRRLGRMFEIPKAWFANDVFTRMFPPKLRRAVSDTVDDLVESFKEQRLKEVFKRMLPGKRSNDSKGAELDDRGFNFTLLPKAHVHRLVQEIGKLPEHVQDKLIGVGRLPEMDIPDLENMFPTNVFPAFTNRKFDEVRNMTLGQTHALCKRLLMVSSAPGNLEAAVNGGIDCLGTFTKLSSEKKVSRSKSQILMDYIRSFNMSEVDPEFVTSVFTKLESVLTPSDIESLPTAVFKESLSNITSRRLPYKSQRRALLRKVEKDYGNPIAWPDDVLEWIGGLIDDMNFHEISYLRKDYIVKAEESLRSRMKSYEKRFAISKYMASPALQWINSMDTESIKRAFPWLTSDRSYLDNLNLTNLLEALNAAHNLTENIRPGEVSILATRLSSIPEFLNISAITSEEIDSFGNLLDGFDASFFNQLSDETLHNSKVIPRMHFSSKAKSRTLLHRIKKNHRCGNLFNNIGINDLKNLDAKSVFEAVVDMDHINVDQAVAKQIISKLKEHFHGNRTHPSCLWSQIPSIADLVRYLPMQMILEGEIILVPARLSAVSNCTCVRCQHGLTKSQLYAGFEMAKESFRAQNSDSPDFNANFFEKIGRLVLGMTAEDIENLPEDTELPTIIEILTEFEDDMDSSQVEAIANKIRGYFDMDNRKKLEEVTTVTVSQIGRFLQYLDVSLDLPKFPKALRMDIAKEIGKSNMNKISMGKRNLLLKFALKNMKTEDEVIKDLTRAEELDEIAIQDLGYLRCGMMRSMINKLTAKAIEENIEEIQLCPFRVAEASTLVGRTLDLNTNRLRRRELLVGIGALLPYVSAEDLTTIEQNEIASVSEYIVELLAKREKETESREKNGFIREWTSVDKVNTANDKRKLLLNLNSALQFVSQSDPGKSCHVLRSLGPNIPQIYVTMGTGYNDKQAACNDELGNLPNWGLNAARDRLEAVIKLMTGTGGMEEAVDEMTPEMIKQNAGLVKGLRPSEIRRLNLNDTEVVAEIGEFNNYSVEQLRAAFETWKEQTRGSNLSADNILALKNILCGITPDFMGSMIEPEAIRETAEAVGQLTTCSPEQLEVLASKLTQHNGFGTNSTQWKTWEIAAAGHIIGGLSPDQLSNLTIGQIHAVTPETITKMPVEKVKEFSVAQLAAFTENQKNAITSMQRSFMDEAQMAAITGEAGRENGGDKEHISKLLLGLLLLLVTLAG